MKLLRKFSSFLILLCMLLSVFSIQTFAETSTQDGLEVTLTTDRNEYNKDEQIVVNLTVKNTNEIAVTNVSLKNLIPEGYQLANGFEATKQIDVLNAGESVTSTVAYVTSSMPETDGKNDGYNIKNDSGNKLKTSPKTSDNSNIVPLVVLIVFSGGGIFVVLRIGKKKRNAILSILLCIAMIGAFVNNVPINSYAIETKNPIHVETRVAVDGMEVAIQAIITCDALKNDSTDLTSDIELDVSSFEYHESNDENFYFLSNVLDTISGTAIGVDNIESVKYNIKTYSGDILQEGTIEIAESWSVEEIGFSYGYNTLTITADLKNGSNITKEYIIVNEELENVKNLGIDINKDSDNDTLPDYLEEMLGTDALSHDTDGDGLPDNIEIFVSEISPISVDSDGNGVHDGDEDSDTDGLTNLEEYKLRTDLSGNDTDGDSLLDGDEVFNYYTNPLVADTDGDGISDKKEIEIGSDPLVAETSFDYVASYTADEKKVTPTIEINGLTAEQVNNLYIGEVNTGLLADETIPGYIDSAFSFSEIGEFGEAKLTFELDPELFNDEFEPAIYWFNEDTQLLEKLEDQVISGNTVSATVTHFSKYIVLNSFKFSKVWEYRLLYDENATETFHGIDVVFVLDSSGSMSSNDSSDNRKAVTKKFIDNLTENDLAAVIDFDNWAHVYSGFVNDKKELYAAVDGIDSSGGTNLSAGISEAINLFRDEHYDSTGRLKYIIMLTDGDGTYDTSYTTQAMEDNIVIYTVGLGDSVSIDTLTAMAEGTGGSYYHADKADELNGIFKLIAEESDLAKDSDNDGISDYHEKEMANGNLRLGNGVPLTGINYLVSDTDGDGLLDGEEVAIMKIGNFVFAYLKSNPVFYDTDGDNINDKDDKYPLVSDISEVLVYKSDKSELKDQYGNDAEDLEYNDKNYLDLIKVSKLLWNANTEESYIWSEFDHLLWGMTVFADDNMKNIVSEMRNRFRSGVGGTYSNPYLTKAVKNHKNVTNTVNQYKKFVTDILSNNDADLSKLDYNSNPNKAKEYGIQKAALNRFEDTFNGLAVSIHDFWGYKVTITDFKKTDTSYSGVLHFHYYDHFGLDESDFKEIYFLGYGFIDWYTLQHYKRFNGAYVPFLTYVDFDVEFSGTY